MIKPASRYNDGFIGLIALVICVATIAILAATLLREELGFGSDPIDPEIPGTLDAGEAPSMLPASNREDMLQKARDAKSLMESPSM